MALNVFCFVLKFSFIYMSRPCTYCGHVYKRVCMCSFLLKEKKGSKCEALTEPMIKRHDLGEGAGNRKWKHWLAEENRSSIKGFLCYLSLWKMSLPSHTMAVTKGNIVNGSPWYILLRFGKDGHFVDFQILLLVSSLKPWVQIHTTAISQQLVQMGCYHWAGPVWTTASVFSF